MADITKAIASNDIKNGSTISGVNMMGDVQSHFQVHDSNTPALSSLEDKYSSRFDDPKYYGGQNSLLTGLVAWYKLDELSGVRRNSFGDGTDLTDNNTVGANSSGMIQSRAHFKKTSLEYLSLDATSADAFDINGSFSISLWFNMSTTTSNMDLMRMWDSALTHKFRLYWKTSTRQIRFYTTNALNSDSYTSHTGPSGTFSASTWYHLLCIYDDDAGTKETYVNNADLVTSGPGQTIRASVDSGMQIGGTSYFSGGMDEVGFWSKALSSDERAALYNSGNGITYPGF